MSSYSSLTTLRMRASSAQHALAQAEFRALCTAVAYLDGNAGQLPPGTEPAALGPDLLVRFAQESGFPSFALARVVSFLESHNARPESPELEYRAASVEVAVTELNPGLDLQRPANTNADLTACTRHAELNAKLEPERRLAQEVARRLRSAREEHGLTQQELSELTGMQRPNISRVESGRVLPELETIRRYAEVIGCSVNEIMGAEGV